MTTTIPMLERARDLQDTLVEWRRDIHMHPELSFQELRTARLVANTLRDMGIEVETGVGKTGVVAHIGEGRPLGIKHLLDRWHQIMPRHIRDVWLQIIQCMGAGLPA